MIGEHTPVASAPMLDDVAIGAMHRMPLRFQQSRLHVLATPDAREFFLG